jgi:hypothetical protein
VPLSFSRAARALSLAALLGLAAACGGAASTPTALFSAAPQAFPPPDIAGFLKHAVATPTACPANQQGSASGLASPWVGHVDISVFIDTTASPKQIKALGRSIKQASPRITKVYFESQAEAYAEFQRLYTCWANVDRSETPASYRVVLTPTTRIDARNDLVADLIQLPHVDSVSCDPSLPCTQVVRSATPAPSG